MPIILHEYIQPEGEIGIWQCEESMEFFFRQMSLFEVEVEEISKLSSRKKMEWLSSRYLLHHMSGREVRGACLKDEYGKPYLAGSRYLISMSHSLDLTAVIAAPVAVGIDIQYPVAKIGRIAHRFMNDTELSMTDPDDIEKLHLIWGAKECVFKAFGRKSLDFRQHIQISIPKVIDTQSNKDIIFEGFMNKNDHSMRFKFLSKKINEAILVYAIEQ